MTNLRLLATLALLAALAASGAKAVTCNTSCWNTGNGQVCHTTCYP